MTPFEREVRAAVYTLLVDGVRRIDAGLLSQRQGWSPPEVGAALEALQREHRLALGDDGAVWMAHPFSGVATGYWAVIGDRWWQANCAWDSLAILALMGDGDATGPNGLIWQVNEGTVHPDGVIHLTVPARDFWDDIGFT
jgi:hypothetical protein